MSWSLRDVVKAGLPTPTEPPPQPVIDDSLPLPSFGHFSLDDDDPPSGWGAAQRALKQEGWWTEKELDAYRRLMYRGVEVNADAPEPGTPAESAHTFPQPRPSWWSALKRLLPGTPEPAPEPADEPAPVVFRSPHTPPPGWPGYRPGGGYGE